jgi:predicted Zn-dependent protease
MIVSEESAIMKSSSAYNSLIGGLAKSGKLTTDIDQISRVKDITDRLITQAVEYRPETKNWQWSINVIDDPETVNAFCMAGGKMAIYSGLIEKVDPTDDELAQVMGHEISHALASHTAEKMSVQLATELAVLTATAIADSNNQQAVHDISSIAALTLVSLPNSRTAESEADKIGIEIAAKAGYDPHAAVTLWEKMIKVSGGSSRFDFLSTHPSSPKRIEALTGLVMTMEPLYVAGKLDRDTPPYAWSTVASNLEIPGNSGNNIKLPGFNYRSTAQRLREIHSLKIDGVITESDYQKKKEQLLENY